MSAISDPVSAPPGLVCVELTEGEGAGVEVAVVEVSSAWRRSSFCFRRLVAFSPDAPKGPLLD